MYSENENLKGSNPYSGSKVAKENLIYSFAKSLLNNKNIIIVRSGNVIGGGDWSSSRLIPDIVNSFINGKKFIMRNPTHTRPWQHIFDVLSTYLKLVKKIHKKRKFLDYFNVSFHNNKQRSVKEIVKIFKKDKLFERIKILRSKNKKYEEDQFLNISNKKIKKFISIKSQFSSLEDSIKNVISWYNVYLSNKNSIQDYSKKELTLLFKDKY